jgi:two-component system cell cycle sensor histidine kinase PleC
MSLASLEASGLQGRRAMPPSTLASQAAAHRSEENSSTGGMRHELDTRMLFLFARASRRTSSVVAVFSCVVATFAAFFVPLAPLALWLGAQASIFFLGQRLAVRFLNRPEDAIDVRLWRGLFVALETARGLLWGALAGLVIAASDDPAGRAFASMTSVSASAMVATVSASIPASVVAAMLSMSALVLVGILSAGPDLGALPLAALTCCAQLYLLRVAGTLHAIAEEASAIEDEKDNLIAELAAATASSDCARRRAEEANFAKSRFLAAMSHELRTPLNAILGFSEVMKGELFGAHSVASYREYSTDIHASGQHLLVLINEILDLSRIEAGRFELEENPVKLANLVEGCKHLLALRAKDREISVETVAEPDLPALLADERAIRQMVLNLLTNAINFTPRGGAIRLKIGWTGRGGQYFSVRDSGPGIPEEEIPTIMTPFVRGTLARENGEEGTGLGLAIVEGLVALHGGSFRLRSKLREGTEVVVTFPPERVTAFRPDALRREREPPAR